MKKLYKTIGKSIQYWEIWDNNNIITIHWWVLGERGETKDIKVKFWQKTNNIIDQEIKKIQDEGFLEIDLEDCFTLIVQFQINGKDWNEDDLKKCHFIENLINESLGWTGNGHCDGFDIWSGTFNIFSFVINPDIAMKIIINDFKNKKIVDNFIIAKQKDEEIIVLYPENYQGEFQY